MEEDRRTRLPKWLVNWFMASHPEYLIWKLVEYDLLEEAFIHAFQMVEAVRGQRLPSLCNVTDRMIRSPRQKYSAVQAASALLARICHTIC